MARVLLVVSALHISTSGRVYWRHNCLHQEWNHSDWTSTAAMWSSV